MNEQATITEWPVAERLQGIEEYYFSQKLQEIERLNKAGKNILNLGIGSPDLPPHADVINVLEAESKKPNVHGYQGYKGVPVFRTAIAQWYQKWYSVSLNPDTEVLPLIGSKEGIVHICMGWQVGTANAQIQNVFTGFIEAFDLLQLLRKIIFLNALQALGHRPF